MTMQWPNEREFVNRQPIDGLSIDLKDEFRQLMEACPSGLTAAFDEAVEWIEQQGDDTSELEQRMNAVNNELELADFPESVNLLMAWTCAEALAKAPSLQTWKSIRKLKSYSWQLEHWLSDTMMVYAEEKASAKEVYIKLAKEVFEALDSFQLISQFDRHNKEREQFREAWNDCSEKLDEIWWGLRGSDCMDYEERPLFQVLGTLDSVEFMSVVSQSTNPYLVNSAFFAVGAYDEFNLWEKFSVSAPTAFVDDGAWNTSVEMPLLLVMARDQLLQAGRLIPHFDVQDAEVEKVKQEIASLTEAVIEILSKRQDALPLFARWSTWLMRQLLIQGIKDTNNVRSSTFVDTALIESIGRKLKGQNVISASPSDAPAWEAWCYQAVLASHAHSGFIDPPDSKNFMDVWGLAPDDWAGERGKQLRERASLIVTMTKEIPGDAAHFLAYPITMSESPVDAWIGLWNVTQPLREIVEFGDADDSESDKYQGSTEAGKLLWLVFCIGLAILDQRVSQCSSGASPQARDLAQLHEALASAVREMREIDYFLSRDQWLQAFQHLAVRRLIWEDRATKVENAIFHDTDKPTFSDYLIDAKNDAMELLAILQITLNNESDHQLVQEKLNDASIDLAEVITTVKRLNTISDRKYPIDVARQRIIDLLKKLE
ncbi:hypothetical protein [Methylobacter sp.]|nr:hypothetical protein [Methylobacter sp.]